MSPNFKDLKISHKVKVTCGPCLKGNCYACIPLSKIKKITCQCAFLGHEDRGAKGKVENVL